MSKRILILSNGNSSTDYYEKLFKNDRVEYCISLENGVQRLEQNSTDMLVLDCPSAARKYIGCLKENRELRQSLYEAGLNHNEMVRANQAIKRRLKTIAHEAFTALQVIINSSSRGILLSNGNIYEYFLHINEYGGKFQKLCERYLKTSAPNEEIQYKYQSIKISSIILQTLTSNLPLAQEKQIQVYFSPPSFDDTVSCDEISITQVVQNILTNAIKFSPENGKITVRVENTSDNNISISIEDTGAGIPENDLEKIFDIKEEESIGSEIHDGFGLGLSISKEIISDHHGRIWAENIQEGGSKFTFSLSKNINC